MATLTVGSDKQFTTISAAVAASQDGDIILVDAGTYTNDYAHITTDITLTAVGGMVSMVSTQDVPNGKGILVTDGDITVNGFEFSGATVADENGAGIRYQSGNLVLNGCYFHDNENGLLAASDPTGSITIDDCEFARNGVTDPNSSGYGLTHNLYVNQIAELTIIDSYFHDAAIGHEIKSRAANTTILNSRIQDEAGTASYSIDLPNGGNALIQGNVIEQGSSTENPIIITIGEEGNVYASTSIQISSNVILNDHASSSDLAIRNLTATIAEIGNNSFYGLTPSQIAQGPNTQTDNQFLTTAPPLDTSHPFDPVPCFVRGTRILTDRGQVPVEALAVGELVITQSGALRPIKWIGRRAYKMPFIARSCAVLPICIEAGALGRGTPARDLFVSPEHALVIDGRFLPARTLVNGITIRQVEVVDRIEYLHIELETHDVVFAEGAATETFIDIGGRGRFHNRAEFVAMYANAEAADWNAYAALLQDGAAELTQIRAALLARAEAIGRVSRNPDLHLIVDDVVVLAEAVTNRVFRFHLHVPAGEVTIASRNAVPAETEADSLDVRRLGVPVERIALSQPGMRVELLPSCPALRDGFHRDERSHRWTDGRAILSAGLFAHFAHDVVVVEIQIGATHLHYPVDPRSCSREWIARRKQGRQ